MRGRLQKINCESTAHANEGGDHNNIQQSLKGVSVWEGAAKGLKYNKSRYNRTFSCPPPPAIKKDRSLIP